MPVRRLVLLAVICAAVVASCGGSREPSADELKVCSIVQAMVDAPDDGGGGQTVLARLPELEQAVNATSNERMSNAGTAFFDEFFTDIDYTQLTLPQTQELGRYYLEVLSEHLAEIVNACDEAGAAIEGI